MSATYRLQLAAILARIDQELARAQEIADENGRESQSAREFIAEFEETWRDVEGKLNSEGHNEIN